MEDKRLLILKNNLESGDWLGGARHFHNASLSQIRQLVKRGYLKLSENQNNSPTTAQFIKFMNKWKKYKVTAHGYIISLDRKDARVTIEGLSVGDVKDDKFRADWFEFNNGANNLDKNRSWWD